MDNHIGHLLTCKQCNKAFVICTSCYRGHKYCSENCKTLGYSECRNKARKKYDKSIEAKLDHKDRSQRYRDNLKNKYEENVTDKSSKVQHDHLNIDSCNKLTEAFNEIKNSPGVCIVCKKIIFQELKLYGGST